MGLHVKNNTMNATGMGLDQLADHLQQLLKGGSAAGVFFSVALAYAGGILSSLTPCIYPMIPITVGVVGGARGKHEHTKQGVFNRNVLVRGFAYVMGMAIIYAFLGVLAGITGQVFGAFTNTARWYIILGVVMTFASLMMIDVIPFFFRHSDFARDHSIEATFERSKDHSGYFIDCQNDSTDLYVTPSRMKELSKRFEKTRPST